MANKLLEEAKKWARDKFGIGVAGTGSVGNAVSGFVQKYPTPIDVVSQVRQNVNNYFRPDTSRDIRTRDIVREAYQDLRRPTTQSDFASGTRKIFSKQGFASPQGMLEVAKAVPRTALKTYKQLDIFNPGTWIGRKINPRFYQMRDELINRGIEGLAPAGTDVQQAIGVGAEAGLNAPAYLLGEKAFVDVVGRALPIIAKSAAGRYVLRRGADITSGQVLTPKEEMVGGSRLKQAGVDVAFGGLLDFAGGLSKAISKVVDDTIPVTSKRSYSKNVPIGGKVAQTVENAKVTPPLPDAPLTGGIVDDVAKTGKEALGLPAPEPKTVWTSVRDALKNAKDLSPEQAKLYAKERATRFAKAGSVAAERLGREGYYKQLGVLKGGLPKVDFEGIEQILSKDTIEEAFNAIDDFVPFITTDKLTAKKALEKLLTGKLPGNKEIDLLSQVAGSDLTKELLRKRTLLQKFADGTTEIIGGLRSLKAGMDVSAAGRQVLPVLGYSPSNYFKAVGRGLKTTFSQSSFDKAMGTIYTHPKYETARRAGLQLTNLGTRMGQREEQIVSDLAEKIPLLGRLYKASNRNFAATTNLARFYLFDSMTNAAKAAGVTNPRELEGIADVINNLTGRGGKWLDKKGLTNTLSTGLFAPKFIASRFNAVANPYYYASLPPFARKQAVKAYVGFASLVGTTLGLLKAANISGVEVETDPRSADFAKIKIGNTRIDITAGYGQYIRVAFQIAMGEKISTITGELSKADGQYGSPNRLNMAMDFFLNKTSPVASFGQDILRGEDAVGNDITVGGEISNLVSPLVLIDMYDAIKSQGASGLMYLPVAMLGFGVQTYSPEPKGETAKEYMKTLSPSEKNQYIDDYAQSTSKLKEANAESRAMSGDILTSLSIGGKQGEARPATAESPVTEKPGKMPAGIKQAGGMFLVPQKDGTIKKYDNEQEARDDLARQELRKSGKKQMTKDGMVYTMDKAGKISVDTVEEYQFSLKEKQWTLDSDKYKAEKDYTSWRKGAMNRYFELKKYLDTLDPEADELEAFTVQKQIQDLLQDVAKYDSYGGKFTKGSGGGGQKGKVSGEFGGVIKKPTSRGLQFELTKPRLYGTK